MDSGIPWPYPADGVLTYYRDITLPAMERGEEWHWSIRLKSAPEEAIGGISLVNAEDHNRGFWLGLTWQGRGLMSEASDAVTTYLARYAGLPDHAGSQGRGERRIETDLGEKRNAARPGR